MTKQEHKYFLNQAFEMKQFSDDPRTQTGAVIVDIINKGVVSSGSNTLPKGTQLTSELIEILQTDEKYEWIEHAERNAIANAISANVNITGFYIYATYYPCAPCARMIINSGLKAVIVPSKPDYTNAKWGKSWQVATKMFENAKVKCFIMEK